jgi:hypothetical protein
VKWCDTQKSTVSKQLSGTQSCKQPRELSVSAGAGSAATPATTTTTSARATVLASAADHPIIIDEDAGSAGDDEDEDEDSLDWKSDSSDDEDDSDDQLADGDDLALAAINLRDPRLLDVLADSSCLTGRDAARPSLHADHDSGEEETTSSALQQRLTAEEWAERMRKL